MRSQDKFLEMGDVGVGVGFFCFCRCLLLVFAVGVCCRCLLSVFESLRTSVLVTGLLRGHIAIIFLDAG